MTFTADLDQLVAANSNGLMGKRHSWQRVRLGTIARIQNGFPFESARFSRTAGVPLIRIRDIIRGATDTYYSASYDPAFLVSRGDLLVGMDGDFNCELWLGPDGLLNQRVCRIIPDESRCSRRYLRYVLPGYLAAINASTPSVTVKHLSSRTVANIPVPLPPIEEQAELVASLDAQMSRMAFGCAALVRVRANLKRYRAAVLKAACEGRLVPTEAELARQAGRPGDFESGSALLGRILEERRRGWKGKGKYKEPAEPDTTDLPELPEGWAWASVAQLLRESPCNGLSVKGSDSPPGVRALRLGAMSDVGFDYEQVRYLPLKRSDVEDLLVADGDFFISRGNGTLALVGRGTLAQAAPRETIFPDTMIRLRLSLVVLGTNWIPRIWASPFIRTQVEARVKTTAGIYKISQPEAANIVVPVPPLAEQIRIVAEMEHRLSVVAELEAAVEANLRRGASLRQAILQRAFSGAGQTPHD